MEILWDKLNDSDKDCVVVGDFNVDLLCSLNSDQKKLADIVNTRNFCIIVGFPTRETSSTSTCLDHVYVDSECVLAGAVSETPVLTHLSDHYAVRVQLQCKIQTGPALKHFARAFTRANNYSFNASLASIDWHEISQISVLSANGLAVKIVNVVNNMLDICYPYKCVTPRRNGMNSWVSDESIHLESLIRDMKSMRNQFPENMALDKKILEFQNRLDVLLKSERTSFYCNLVAKSKNMTKTMWDVMKIETGRSKRNLDFIDFLKRSDGSQYPTEIDAVDAMNEHFVGAALSCGAPAADVPAAMRALKSVRLPADRSLRFKRFTPGEVHKILTTGVARKPTRDIYDISVYLLNTAADTLAVVLSTLYNRCLVDGDYPLVLKNVRVSPLYKGKGTKDDVNSYRPVSIIPGIAKVFEHGLSARLKEHLSSTKSLSDRQYAYRPGKSTTDVARELVRRVLDARERQMQVAIIFCDLSKAFDVADHSVLAAKLEHYGVRGSSLRLLLSSMTNRSQTVTGRGGKIKSKALPNTIGVAQGSSISNILFSLLMNDLPECIKDAHILMYADDVAAVVEAPKLDALETRV